MAINFIMNASIIMLMFFKTLQRACTPPSWASGVVACHQRRIGKLTRCWRACHRCHSCRACRLELVRKWTCRSFRWECCCACQTAVAYQPPVAQERPKVGHAKSAQHTHVSNHHFEYHGIIINWHNSLMTLINSYNSYFHIMSHQPVPPMVMSLFTLFGPS